MEWLDCVLDGTKEAVLKELEKRSAAGVTPEPFLIKKSGQLFYNTSPLDMKKLMGDQDHIKENLFAYVQGFSPSVKDIFECFDFYTQVDRLSKAGLLYLVSEKFANIDRHPAVVSKPAHRKGKLQLIDASGMWQKMRKSLGSKRKELSEDHIAEITRLFGECKER